MPIEPAQQPAAREAAVVRIDIPGEMRGKGRPRFARRGKFVQAYSDEKTANAETWVRACAVDRMAGAPPFQGPLQVHIAIDVVPPASWSQKKRALALVRATAPTGKPDLDNCVKLIADALNGLVWQDDKQIVRLVAEKRYAPVAQTVLHVREIC